MIRLANSGGEAVLEQSTYFDRGLVLYNLCPTAYNPKHRKQKRLPKND